jgi:hypothetical protein
MRFQTALIVAIVMTPLVFSDALNAAPNATPACPFLVSQPHSLGQSPAVSSGTADWCQAPSCEGRDADLYKTPAKDSWEAAVWLTPAPDMSNAQNHPLSGGPGGTHRRELVF